MITLLYADSTAGQTQAAPSPLISFMPLLVIFVIFYFLLIRPQQKKAKQHKQLLDNLKAGDKVITSSGFFATVVGIGDTTVEIKLNEPSKVKILKSSVSDILNNHQETAASSLAVKTEK